MSIVDNLRVDLGNKGLTGVLISGNNISGSREDLVAKNISQTRIPDKGEFPDMFTGFESRFGDYTFNSTHRENEIRIIAIIDKYTAKIASIPAGSNPMRTVIYRDLKTMQVSYFDIHKYTHYTNDYGYENIMQTNIQVEDIISPDVEIYSSPAKDGDLYKLGVNANVAFMTTLETTEDCFPISESLANRLSPKSIEIKSINIDMRRYPLNLYGDDETYRIFSNIGDHVNPDGVLCAFRPLRRCSAISDLQENKLQQLNHLFDHKIYAHPGAQVVDIEVYFDVRGELPSRIFEQIKIYHEARLSYWKEIVQVYETVKNLELSHKFNTLVARAMGRILAAKLPVAGLGKCPKAFLSDGFNPINLRVDIMLVHQVVVNNGHKFAGRDGAKGVGIIKPDEEMPINDYGVRADICIDLISVIKRTNIIQFYEQFINCILKYQAQHLHELGSIENQFARIVEVLTDINPEYGKLIAEMHPTIDLQTAYINECRNDTIKICIPSGCDSIDSEMVKRIISKYHIPISPVEFVINTTSGKKKVRTKEPVLIGTKYLFLLSKYPKPLAPGYGYVNKCHVPINPGSSNNAPIGATPIRFGESESRIFATTTDIPTILRLKCLYSGSRIGPKAMIGSLMNTPNPSQLERVGVSTEELYDDNPSIQIAHHMFQTCGLNVQRSLIDRKEAEQIFEDLKLLS